MLDYDRVFSAMGIPACLWRRTGEIYKANREFAELVGLDGIMFREVIHSVLGIISVITELKGAIRAVCASMSSWLKNLPLITGM
jgi:hypothetical protein